MDKLLIEQTSSTPAVLADEATGRLEMHGDSYPENSFDFFQPILDWIEAYLGEGKRPLQLELELVYLNTSSIRAMMDIFDLLDVAHRDRGVPVSVRWRYDAGNERVGDLAREFAEDWTFPFEVLPQSKL